MTKQMIKSLYLAAVAAVMFALPSFADGKDVTRKLYNPDCEALMDGWGITFTTSNNVSGNAWKTTSHTESWQNWQVGYWGFQSTSLECWGGGNDIGANSISQQMTNLPNGTYVFGAFAVATIQAGKEATQSSVEGAYIFAGDNKVAIATNDPQYGSYEWSHTWKFNVAATVTDGTLKVGLGCDENTNVNYISFDNASLYYFGDVTTDEALTQMRQIDLKNAIAAADTLKAYTMAADTLAAVNAAIDAAAGKTSVADCEAAEEAIRTICKKARFSIHDYETFADLIAEAKEVLGMEWEYVTTDDLEEATAQAETDLKAAAMNRQELKEYMATFENTINMVRVDDLYTWIDVLGWFVNNYDDEPNDPEWYDLVGIEYHPGFGDEIGQYPEDQLDNLSKLYEEASSVLTQIDGAEVPATQGVPYITKIQEAIATCITKAVKGPSLPLDVIFIPDPTNSEKAFVSTTPAGESNTYMQKYKSVSKTDGTTECFRYESPVITLPYPVKTLVMTVLHTAYIDRSADANTDGPFFNISEFYLYDEEGEEIPLTGADFSSNAKESWEGSYDGLCDKNLNTYFHSSWHEGLSPEGYYHNLQLNMPDGLLNFKIAIEIIWSEYRLWNMPTEVVFSGLSNAKVDLASKIASASNRKPANGTEPGFNTGDFTAFYDALNKAQEIYADAASTDTEYAAALEELTANIDAAENAPLILPEVGTVYKIANQGPFVSGQGKVKNLTVFQDSIMWWADADPADAYQDFTFEEVAAPADAAEGDIFMAIKNVKTGKYIGPFTETPGEEDGAQIIWGNDWYVKLADEPTPIKLRSLGCGQLAFYSPTDEPGGWLCLHACNHNEGLAYANPGLQGGGKGGTHPDGYSIAGVCGPIAQWETGAYAASAWYIRQQEELPLTVLIENGYDQQPHHLYTPVQFLTFTSEKACNFDGLQITDIFGDPIDCTITTSSRKATVNFGGKYVETFCFSFDGDADKLTINGGSIVTNPKIAELQEAYDAAIAAEYIQGDQVGMAKDLTAYEAALTAAETLLDEGGSDEAYDACIQALAEAIAGIQLVLPEAGKTYFIVNAYEAFKANWNTEMALFANASNRMPGWTFISLWDPCYQWQFEYIDETHFKLYNVGTQSYISSNLGGNNLEMNGVGGTYRLISRGSQKFALHNTEGGDDENSSWLLHPYYHNEGSSPFGAICHWGHETPSKSEWYIREAGSVQTGLETISTETTTLNNAVEGIYDLTGRRVDTPEKGLYIINGQKVLIK